MENQFKPIIIIAVASLGVFLLVIFWPKLTKKKPPAQVQKFREEVKGTKIGKDIVNILGTETSNEDNQNKRPLDSLLENTSTVITKTTDNVIESVKEKITNIILETTSSEIVKKLNSLPKEEINTIKKEFCQ